MSDETASVALERRAPLAPISAGLISDDEVRRMYRIAEALALSGSFKGINKAEQAFAKMIVGRDFGMTPAQSMLGLHLVEGSVMVHYAMLGRFIRERSDEGYAYRTGWIRESRYEAGEPNEPTPPPVREFVWADEDDPADMREVVGASVWFWGEGGQHVGISTFTREDAEKANLIRPGLDQRAAWNTSRRNMYLARAMSNGVKWFVPEVMGGLPIYVEGEIVETQSVTAPVGEGGDDGQGIDLGPKVEAIMERARAIGHVGLSNRGALELALGNRAPGVVKQWIKDANAELDRYEEELAAQDTGDSEVVPDDAMVVAENGVPEGALADEPTLADQAADDRAVDDMEKQVWINRIAALEAARGEEQDPEQKALMDEEIEQLRALLRGDEAE